MRCLYSVASVFCIWLFQTHSQLSLIFTPPLFLFLSPSKFPACLFVLHCVTCKWTRCLRWHNLPVSKQQPSTPSGMMEKKKKRRRKMYKHIQLHLYRRLCASSARVCSLALWCLFTSEKEMIFIQFTDDWLILYLHLFDLLLTGNTSMHTNTHTQTWLECMNWRTI